MSSSALWLNATNTRANKLCALLRHEPIDLFVPCPAKRLASLFVAPIALPAYPGVISRTFEGTLTLARAVPVVYRRASTPHFGEHVPQS